MSKMKPTPPNLQPETLGPVEVEPYSPYSQRAADTEDAVADMIDDGEFDDILFPSGRKIPRSK